MCLSHTRFLGPAQTDRFSPVSRGGTKPLSQPTPLSTSSHKGLSPGECSPEGERRRERKGERAGGAKEWTQRTGVVKPRDACTNILACMRVSTTCTADSQRFIVAGSRGGSSLREGAVHTRAVSKGKEKRWPAPLEGTEEKGVLGLSRVSARAETSVQGSPLSRGLPGRNPVPFVRDSLPFDFISAAVTSNRGPR